MKNKKLNYIIPCILVIGFAVWAWIRLVVENSDLLYEAQNQSFWQPGRLFLEQTLLQPGGWISWVGKYLTQYFYYPALGAFILIALWLIIYLLWTYCIKPMWYLSWIGMFFPVMLLMQVTSTGYLVYICKAPDWYFTPTLMCLLFSLLLGVAGIFFGPKTRYCCSVVVAVALMGSLYSWANKSEIPSTMIVPFNTQLDDVNFHAELHMKHALEKGKWQEALSEMRHAGKNPTRAMWLMKNVALLNQGRLTNDWLEYGCMTQIPTIKDSILVPMVESTGECIYFQHGSIQFAYRWCMENNVEFGASNGRLRLMTLCALIKEEWDLAEKYVNLLSRTTFHKEWAEQQRRYIGHPELLANDPICRTAIIINKARMNGLDGDAGQAENFIVNTYASNNMHQCYELAQLGVIYALQSQNIKNFWNQFYVYANLNGDKPMPLLIQEAIYLFINLEPQSAPRHDFPFDPQVPKLYEQFNARVQQLSALGYKDDALATALQKEFGKTYFWFYFFCRNLKTY